MLDSSGRRALRANGTVLDLLPIGQAVGITGLLLVALFTLIRPEASMGLSAPGRLLFWTLHVGLGLASIWLASRWLASGLRLPHGTLSRVLLTGFAGIALAAPGYVALDQLFAPYQIDQASEESAASLVATLINETVEISPWFMASWLLINLPVLLPRPTLPVQTDDTVRHTPAISDDIQKEKKEERADSIFAANHIESISSNSQKQTDNIVGQIEHSTAVQSAQQPIADRFLSTLPGILGKDVIAVSSDLHYLNVWTHAGRATVLGNLRDVVEELNDIGMQVHRSHWIAYSHVRRIVGTAGNGNCILSNELRIPISRRRWKEVREQFGRGVVLTSENILDIDSD